MININLIIIFILILFLVSYFIVNNNQTGGGKLKNNALCWLGSQCKSGCCNDFAPLTGRCEPKPKCD